MTPALARRLAVLGGWPRRLAALACLLAAAATALQPPPAPAAGSSPGPRPVLDGLHPGEVAVPVALAGSANCALLRPGDVIDLYPASDEHGSGPAPTAVSGLRVLDVSRCTAGTALAPARDEGPSVVVAAAPAAAAELAPHLPTAMVAMLHPPR